MGWTTIVHNRNQAYSSREILNYFKEYFSPYEIVDFSIATLSECYLALKTPDGIFAVVCLIKNSGNQFAYKAMDESCGPYYYNCPKRILNKLSKTDNKYAQKWRQKSYQKFSSEFQK